MKKDIYISILKHGVENGLALVQENEIFYVASREGFLTQSEYEQLVDGSKSLDQELQKKKYLLLRIFEDNFEYVNLGDGYLGRRLTTEAYFKYIEFIELSESLIASKEARKYSIMALVISVFAIVVSSLFAWIQLNNPVEIVNPIRIEENQMKELNNKLEELGNKLDTIQLSKEKYLNTIK